MRTSNRIAPGPMLMLRPRCSGLLLLATLACADPAVRTGPTIDRLPTGLQVEGLGRIAIDEPLQVQGVVHVRGDSMPAFFMSSPVDDWYRLPIDATGFSDAWVWVRGGTVGCFIAFYRPGTSFGEKLDEMEQRLGPALRIDSLANPMARWTVWGDRRTVWGVVGPQPHGASTVALMIAARDPRQDPADPTYFARCSNTAESRPWLR